MFSPPKGARLNISALVAIIVVTGVQAEGYVGIANYATDDCSGVPSKVEYVEPICAINTPRVFFCNNGGKTLGTHTYSTADCSDTPITQSQGWPKTMYPKSCTKRNGGSSRYFCSLTPECDKTKAMEGFVSYEAFATDDCAGRPIIVQLLNPTCSERVFFCSNGGKTLGLHTYSTADCSDTTPKTESQDWPSMYPKSCTKMDGGAFQSGRYFCTGSVSRCDEAQTDKNSKAAADAAAAAKKVADEKKATEAKDKAMADLKKANPNATAAELEAAGKKAYDASIAESNKKSAPSTSADAGQKANSGSILQLRVTLVAVAVLVASTFV